MPVPNLALALSAKVAWEPVNTLNAFAVNVKSSAPAILISIWSSVSAVILVSASASKINSLPSKSWSPVDAIPESTKFGLVAWSAAA